MAEARRAFVVLALALAFVASPSASPAQVPLGSEFMVTGATGIQNYVSIAAGSQGAFVVTWTDRGASTSDRVDARRYDRDGAPIGAEFTVNTAGVARRSAVGASAQDSFVIAWQHYPDGNSWGIHGRRFDASGSPIGGEFQVNTETAAQQQQPSISVAPSGRFVVSWETINPYPGPRTVQAQVFDAAGNRVGGELQVSAGTTRQYGSSVSMDAAGAFLVVWADKDRRGIYGRRYDPAAQPVGGEFRVNTNSAASEIRFASVAQGANGDFLVAWQRSLFSPPPPWPQQPDRYYVNYQRFDPSGAMVGTEQQVPGSLSQGPKVAFHAGGRSTLVWTSDTTGAQGVFEQHFDPAGRPVGSPRVVAAMSARGPAVTAEDASRFVVAWGSPPFVETNVWARRYDRLAPAAMAADATATSGSDGNGVVENGETFVVAPVWANLHGSPVAFGGLATSMDCSPTTICSILDGSADYAIAGGGTGGCDDGTPDCYRLSVVAPAGRPTGHWDVALQEQLTPASGHGTHTWPVHIGETFADVPRASPFYRFVETVLHNDVMSGCTASLFCSTLNVPREHMAVFVLTANDFTFVPPACVAGSEMFADVPASSPYCPWIEELARRGVVAGCGGGNYCPSLAISRETMAVYLLKTREGPAYAPPPCGTPVFADVPASSPFCPWVEELARRAITGGCGGGNYCPTLAVSREQMSVFLTVTFGLALYGP